MTEDEADREVARLNASLGGKEHEYYFAAETSGGGWEVRKHAPKKSLFKRMTDAIGQSKTGPVG